MLNFVRYCYRVAVFGRDFQVKTSPAVDRPSQGGGGDDGRGPLPRSTFNNVTG